MHILSSIWYRRLWNKLSSRWRWCVQCPNPAPLFQSWRKDAQQQLTKMAVYFTDRLHSPCAWLWTLIRGDWGSPTLTTSRMSVYFTDTGIIAFHACAASSFGTTSPAALTESFRFWWLVWAVTFIPMPMLRFWWLVWAVTFIPMPMPKTVYFTDTGRGR